MQVSEHRQGVPSWVELSTTDVEGALRFYGGLFGWGDDPRPMPQGGDYHMQQLEGDNVAAISPQQDEERAQHIPPHWGTYLAVNDVDQAAARVAAAGGQLLMPPMDVMDSGRMAIVADPTGGAVGLWQAKQHTGFGRIREPGAETWAELMTDDPERAAAFFRAVLEVPTEVMPMEGAEPYTLLGPAGEQGAGIMRKPPEMGEMPNVWGVYFEVADTDASAARARELGGTVLSEPMDIMPGRIAMVQDPQGAIFGIIKSNPLEA